MSIFLQSIVWKKEAFFIIINFIKHVRFSPALNFGLLFYFTALTYMMQAVLRRLGSLSNDTDMVDEDELLCHQQLQNLYNSTRAAKVYIPAYKSSFKFNSYKFWLVKSYDVPQITASPVSIFDMEFNNQLWSQHFQRNIVRGVEGFISVSSKQMELGSGFSHILYLFPFSTLVYEILSSIVQWESWPGIVANMEMQMKPFILPLLELLLTLVTRINR